MNIAIIPARKGSKRLKNKNFLIYKKKMMVEHTIISAIKSKIFNKIILSSDSKKALRLSKKYNIDFHWRLGKLSNSKARINDVCLSVVNEFKINKTKNSKIFVLYATAPERNFKDIRKFNLLAKKFNANFAMGITKFNHSPLQALRKKSIFLKPYFKNLVDKKNSTIGNFFAGNGSMYFAKVRAFLKYKSFYGPRLIGYEMPFYKSVDIDDIDDFNTLKMINKL